LFGFGEGFCLSAERQANAKCFIKKSGCVAGQTQIILQKIVGEPRTIKTQQSLW